MEAHTYEQTHWKGSRARKTRTRAHTLTHTHACRRRQNSLISFHHFSFNPENSEPCLGLINY